MNQPKQPEDYFNEFLQADSAKHIIGVLQSQLGRDKDIIESALKVAYAQGLHDGRRLTSEHILGTIEKGLSNIPE